MLLKPNLAGANRPWQMELFCSKPNLAGANRLIRYVNVPYNVPNIPNVPYNVPNVPKKTKDLMLITYLNPTYL